MSFACPSVILYDFSFIQEMEDGFQDETILCILVLIVFSRGCPVRQILDMMATTNEFLSQKTCVVIMITTVMRAKIYIMFIAAILNLCLGTRLRVLLTTMKLFLNGAKRSNGDWPSLSALTRKQRALLVLSLRASPLEQSPSVSNCPFSVMNTYLPQQFTIFIWLCS